MKYVLAYDIGTTGVKTCLFSIESDIRLLASANAGYGLYILPDGGAEQDADEWWDAMCRTTRELFSQSEVKPAQISGISFCSQMQGMFSICCTKSSVSDSVVIFEKPITRLQIRRIIWYYQIQLL